MNTDGRPYAHLTLGMESKDGMSAADILHVRAGQNYLVEDFTRMERLRSDPVVLESLSRVAQEIGFDRVRPYVVENGSYKAMPDMPFTQWENPYFTVDPPKQGDTFTIYQLKDGPETRNYITFIHKGKLVFSHDKDDLVDNYGIVSCGSVIFDTLDKTDTIAYRKEDYQYKVLVRNRNKAAKNYPKAIVSPATIEEIMLFYVKGELQ